MIIFKQYKVFEIHLNELGGEAPVLSGEATFKFSVKLKMSAVDPTAPSLPSPAEWNTICVYVNKLSGSYIRYLIPTSGLDTNIQTDPMPQAVLCFYKGLSVKKSLTKS